MAGSLKDKPCNAARFGIWNARRVRKPFPPQTKLKIEGTPEFRLEKE